MAAIEDDDAPSAQRLRDVVRAARVVIVIAEHRDDGNGEAPARIREHARLLGQAVRGEVAGEQHDIDLLGNCRERPRQPVAERLARVHVAGCGDANRSAHPSRIPAREVLRTPETGSCFC